MAKVKAVSGNVHYSDLGFDNDGEFDNFIVEKISSASRLIDTYCNRPSGFFNGGATLVEYLNGKPYDNYQYSGGVLSWRTSDEMDSRRKFFLSHFPVISVTKVEVNSNDVDNESWVTYTGYKVYDDGMLVFAFSNTPPEGTRNIKVTYNAGYASTPPEIEEACTLLVANLLHKLLASYGSVEFRMGTTVTFPDWNDPSILSSDVKLLLSKYKKRRV